MNNLTAIFIALFLQAVFGWITGTSGGGIAFFIYLAITNQLKGGNNNEENNQNNVISCFIKHSKMEDEIAVLLQILTVEQVKEFIYKKYKEMK